MQKYFDNVISATGTPLSGASVQVNVYGGSAATIYSDNGVTASTNPVVTDSSGYFEFYAANGRYTLSISKAGFPTVTRTDVLLEEQLTLTAAMVGLGNVDNTSDIDKPVSTLQAEAIAASSSNTVQSITFANITSAPDLTLGNIVIFGDLTGTAVTPTPINGVIGTRYTFIWHQDATGSRNVTFDSVDYGSGAASTYMIKEFICVASNTFVLVGSS